MQSKLVLTSALFAAFSNAQLVNIDPNAIDRAGNAIANYASRLATDKAFSADIVAIASAVPASVAANPDALISNLETATALPAWASAIPTSVAASLETLLAAPLKAADDLDSLVAQPAVSSAFANSALPTSVQSALFSDPINFVASVVTADTLAPWVTALPTGVQSQIGSAINAGLNTVAADFETSVKRSAASTGLPHGTGTNAVFTGTKTGSPIAFTGAAVPAREVAVGAAALVAGVGGLLVL